MPLLKGYRPTCIPLFCSIYLGKRSFPLRPFGRKHLSPIYADDKETFTMLDIGPDFCYSIGASEIRRPIANRIRVANLVQIKKKG